MFPFLNDLCCILSLCLAVFVNVRHHVCGYVLKEKSLCMGLCCVAWSWCYIHSYTLLSLEMYSCLLDLLLNACYSCLYTWMRIKHPLKDIETLAILNAMWLCNNTISFPACIYEVPACFPPYLYEMMMFVYRLSHDLWKVCPHSQSCP